MVFHVYGVTPEFYPASDGWSSIPQRLRSVAEMTEGMGAAGMLVPHNLEEFDPWLLAGHVAASTRALIPVVALQPTGTAPHAAARLVAAFVALHERPLILNLVTGAREDELRRVGNHRSHDERYAYLREYTTILRSMLAGEVVTFSTANFEYDRFQLTPRPPAIDDCKVSVAGSSPASIGAAVGVADVIITHPPPADVWAAGQGEELRSAGFQGELGIRIGLVCRSGAEEAWDLALRRFPASRRARQELLLKTRSPNAWSKALAEQAIAEGEITDVPVSDRPAYWLGAFASGGASAPFLVGSYEQVGNALAEYLRAGAAHILLAGIDDDDYGHTRLGIQHATEGAAS